MESVDPRDWPWGLIYPSASSWGNLGSVTQLQEGQRVSGQLLGGSISCIYLYLPPEDFYPDQPGKGNWIGFWCCFCFCKCWELLPVLIYINISLCWGVGVCVAYVCLCVCLLRIRVQPSSWEDLVTGSCGKFVSISLLCSVTLQEVFQGPGSWSCLLLPCPATSFLFSS